MRNQCRSCGSHDLKKTATIPNLPTSLKPGASERRDLELWTCDGCGLVQTRDDLPDGYYDDYAYTAAHTESARAYNEAFVEMVSREIDRDYGRRTAVLDIGCGDGALLEAFGNDQYAIYGIESSIPLAMVAMKRGAWVATPTTNTDGTPGYDVVVLQQALDHLARPGDVLRGCFKELAPGGLIAIETGNLTEILNTGDIGSFTHEHYTYWTHDTLAAALESAGFVNARIVSVKGQRAGSMIVLANKPPVDMSKYVIGVDPAMKSDPWADLMAGADRLRKYCVGNRHLDGWRTGPTLNTPVGYGAAGRGANWINAANLYSGLLTFVMDDDPAKWGKNIPGTDIPIEKPLNYPGDNVIVFSYGYMDEITARLRALGYTGRIVSVLDIVKGDARA